MSAEISLPMLCFFFLVSRAKKKVVRILSILSALPLFFFSLFFGGRQGHPPNLMPSPDPSDLHKASSPSEATISCTHLCFARY